MNKAPVGNEPKNAFLHHGRYIVYYGHSRHKDWHVKLYTITMDEAVVIDPAFLNAATDFAVNILIRDSAGFESYHVSFVILHWAREGYFLLVCRWVDENMLMEDVFFSTFSDPLAFTRFHENRITACVWELFVIYRESCCWAKNYLARRKNSRLNDYLSCVI